MFRSQEPYFTQHQDVVDQQHLTVAETAALGAQLAVSLEFRKSQEHCSVQNGNMPLKIT